MWRWTARAIACLALAVGLTVTALPLWLRTGPGHRTVERLLTRLLNERVPGSVSVGALGGRVIDGLHAENVVVRNPAGELIGQAEWMSVRWRPLALVRHRVIDELTARRPIVMLDRGRWRTPPPKRPSGPATTIERIVARDGRLSIRGTTFENVSGTASMHSRSHLDVHGVSARLGAARLTAYGIVGWGERRRSWVAARLAVRDPRSVSGTGEIYYTPGRLEGAIDELTLAAPLATRLVGGSGPVHLQGDVQGAPDQLSANARASQGGRALRVRAQIDGPRHAASFDAVVAGGPHPMRIHARARYAAGTLIVPALSAAIGNSRLDGAGSLRNKRVRASLTMRLAPGEARWLALRTRTPIRAQLTLEGPLAELVVDARARLGAARLTVKARVDVPRRRGHAVVVVDNLAPAQLSPRAPQLNVSTALTLDGRWVQHALVAEVRVARGRLTVGGRTFDQLDGAGGVRIARSGDVDIRRLSGRWASRRGQPPIAVRGQLRWRAGRVALSAATVSLGGSRWSGSATWVRGRADGRQRISARADEMTLSPELVAELVGRRPLRPWVGHADLDGAPEDLALRVDATTPLGPFAVAGQVRRVDGGLRLARVEARLGDSRLRGSGSFRRGHLTAAVDELLLAPALIHALTPVLDPAWPLRVRGTIDGPLEALDLALRVDGGPSTSELRAELSWPTRRFRVVGHVDSFGIAVLQRRRSHVRGSFELAGEGQVVKDGVVGTLTLRNARGFMMTSPFYRGLADVRFDGRKAELEHARVEIPGAKIGGRGHGAYGEGFRVAYGVVITDAFALRRVPKALQLLIGLNGILPGRTIEGALEKRPGEKVELSHHVLPIGLAQLKLLYRLLTGRVPQLDDD